MYTDDTQMSLSFIDSLMKHDRIDKQYIKNIWVELSQKRWFEDAGQKLPGPYQVLIFLLVLTIKK